MIYMKTNNYMMCLSWIHSQECYSSRRNEKTEKYMKRCCLLSHGDDDSQAMALSSASLTSKTYSFAPCFLFLSQQDEIFISASLRIREQIN